MKILRGVFLFVCALILGTLFYKLDIPIPYMLAAMLTGVGANQLPGLKNTPWPMSCRNAGLMVVGYAIGSAMTINAWMDFGRQSILILMTTLLICCASFILALLMSRLMNVHLPSCVMGMMPGGLAMVMVLVDEDKRFDPNIVMVCQVIRLFTVIFSVPFLVIAFLGGHVTTDSIALNAANIWHWILFLPLGLAGALIFIKLHLPIPWMPGAAFITSMFVITIGSVQSVPHWIMWPAQIALGLKMGMLLDARRIYECRRLVPVMLLSSALLIGSGYLLSLLLNYLYDVPMMTAFLAMAPGGISEMSIAGLSMGADVSVILAYQFLRVFFIGAVVPLTANKLNQLK